MQIKSYRGYARRKERIDPIRIPDFSQKIVQETRDTIRGMQTAQQMHQKNQQDLIDHTKFVQYREQQQVDKNQALTKSFQEAYHQAAMQHKKQAIIDSQNKKVEIEHRQSQLKDLVELSTTAAKGLAEINQNAKKRVLDEATKANFSTPILESVNQWQSSAENHMNFVDWAIKNSVEGIDNLTADQKQFLDSLSGRKALALNIVYSKRLGEVDFHTNPVTRDITDKQGRNLADLKIAEGVHSPAYRALFAEAEKTYLTSVLWRTEKDENGVDVRVQRYDEQFFKKHGYPGIQKHKNLAFAAREELDEIGYNKERLQDTVIRTERILRVEDPVELGNLLRDWLWETKDNPSQQKDIAGAIESLALSNAITPEQLDQIDDVMLYFTPDGKPDNKAKGQRLGDIKSELTANAWKAIKEKQDQENQQEKVLIESATDQVTEAYVQAVSNGVEVDKGWFLGEEKKYTERGWPVPDIIKTGLSREPYSIREAETLIEGYKNSGGLTMRQLYDMNMPASLIQKYQKETIDGPGSLPTETRRKLHDSVFKAIMHKSQQFNINLSTPEQSLMQGNVSMILPKLVNERVLEGQTRIDAYNGVITDLTKQIEAGDGFFGVKKGPDGKPLRGIEGGFTIFERTDFEQNMPAIEKIKADKTSINQPGLVSSSALNQIKQGKTPWIADEIAGRLPDKDKIDVINAIIEAEGLPDSLKRERKGLEKVVEYVDKSQLKRLNNKPSTGKFLIAINETNKKYTPDENPNITAVKAMKPKSTVNVDPENEGADAFTTGGSNDGGTEFGMGRGTSQFNKPLTELTVEEVQSLMRRGTINEAGAYLFSFENLEEAVTNGEIDVNEFFTSDLQDRIAIDKTLRNNTTFLAAGAPVPGGKTWLTSHKRTRKTVNPQASTRATMKKLSNFLDEQNQYLAKESRDRATAISTITKGLVDTKNIPSQITADAVTRLSEQIIDAYQKRTEEIGKTTYPTARGRRFKPTEKGSEAKHRFLINAYFRNIDIGNMHSEILNKIGELYDE